MCFNKHIRSYYYKVVTIERFINPNFLNFIMMHIDDISHDLVARIKEKEASSLRYTLNLLQPELTAEQWGEICKREFAACSAGRDSKVYRKICDGRNNTQLDTLKLVLLIAYSLHPETVGPYIENPLGPSGTQT